MGILVGPVFSLVTLISIPGAGEFTVVTCVSFGVVVGKVERVVNLAEWLLITLLLLILTNIQTI